VLEIDATIGELFQIRGAVELNAQMVNAVLSVGWKAE